jgi:hypothetical protein
MRQLIHVYMMESGSNNGGYEFCVHHSPLKSVTVFNTFQFKVDILQDICEVWMRSDHLAYQNSASVVSIVSMEICALRGKKNNAFLSPNIFFTN